MKMHIRERIYYYLWLGAFCVGGLAFGVWFVYVLFTDRVPPL
jgi:hypothetical protein